MTVKLLKHSLKLLKYNIAKLWTWTERELQVDNNSLCVELKMSNKLKCRNNSSSSSSSYLSWKEPFNSQNFISQTARVVQSNQWQEICWSHWFGYYTGPAFQSSQYCKRYCNHEVHVRQFFKVHFVSLEEDVDKILKINTFKNISQIKFMFQAFRIFMGHEYLQVVDFYGMKIWFYQHNRCLSIGHVFS